MPPNDPQKGETWRNRNSGNLYHICSEEKPGQYAVRDVGPWGHQYLSRESLVRNYEFISGASND